MQASVAPLTVMARPAFWIMDSMAAYLARWSIYWGGGAGDRFPGGCEDVAEVKAIKSDVTRESKNSLWYDRTKDKCTSKKSHKKRWSNVNETIHQSNQ